MIMSVKSGSSTTPAQSNGEIIRHGVLKKLKTLRKKYFVLRAETPECLARLEYYDSERKFRGNLPPKRSIPLKTCFNINKRTDTKQKHVIALYTKDDCFCVVLEQEEDLASWLKDLLKLQHEGVEIPSGQQPKPKFEYVWQVQLCERGLGYGRTGPYRLCLTDKMLTLVKMDEPIHIEVALASIRGCGNLKNFFFMEIGRSHCLGPGEIWIEAEDANIAYNMHTTVSHRFKLCKAQAQNDNQINQLGDTPNGRIRSSSATEPSGHIAKTQGSSGNKTRQNEEDSESTTSSIKASATTSMNYVSGVAMKLNNLLMRGSSKRRHSISGAGQSWASNISHQRTQSLPLASPTTAPVALLTKDHPSIPTSGQSTIATSSIHSQSQLTTCVHSQSTTATSNINQSQAVSSHHYQSIRSGGKRGGHNSKSLRERCDSMPSRPRNNSEGNHHGIPTYKPYLIPFRGHVLRDATHSSPAGSPMSPPSESIGSSYNSIADDHDGIVDGESHQRLHYPLTPSDITIAEEDWPESPRTTVSNSNSFPINSNDYVKMDKQTANNEYEHMSMSPQMGGLTLVSNSESMSSVTSGTPSTDMRFHDYQDRLEKVISYVATEEGEDNRTERAYSVGSKPSQPTVQQALNTENSRIRAFSVGSKQTKRQIRVLPPSHHPPHGIKSNSAPMLTNTRSASSHGSIGPMDDLMEMDFSIPTRSRTNTSTSSGSASDTKSTANQKISSKNIISHLLESLTGHNKTPPGYVEMIPNNKRQLDVSPYVDMTQAHQNKGPSSSAYSYMDMSGPGKQTAYMDMSGSSPAKNQMEIANDFSLHVTDMSTNKHSEYVDMDQSRKRTDSNNSTASCTSKIGASPGYRWNADYLDMTGKNNRHSFSSQISTSPHHTDSMSPKHNDWHFGPQASSRLQPTQNDHMEGYVDMTPGNGGPVHRKQSSLDGNNPLMHHYMVMSGEKDQKKERSQPISIQTTYNNQALKNSSPITITSLLSGRKLSPTTGTPPKFHLPLTSYTTSSPYSSLPRTKTRKDSSSKDSKDSSSSSVTTPSNSSTMFPLSLNSPCSPGSSKTNTPTATKVPASILNIAHKVGDKKACEDYTAMNFAPNRPSKVLEHDDYMDFHPRNAKTPKNCHDDSGYALMQPAVTTTQPNQKSTTLPRTRNARSGVVSPLAGHFSHMELSEVKNVFRPISEKDERMASPKLGDQVPSKLTQDHKNLETANSMEVEEGPYMTLQASSSDYVCTAPLNQRSSSRNSTTPNSSASAVIGSCRPESSTPRLHYASLDLTTNEESDSKSPRTLKNSGSEVNINQTTTFVYADIDFVKSEDLKKNTKCSNSISPGLSSSTVIKP